eukprot:CAMPEP_0171927790 /NCGR_PEP_ID=MMETSP0993-20121228/26166_1 /TAXON_ID=483369 /ORGANISM="non described non described, Strain CCMP2098" /LENGTH=49 /DNA_ID= /DNA_START= /DNA_END= /DNA_ORIENTATION=
MPSMSRRSSVLPNRTASSTWLTNLGSNAATASKGLTGSAARKVRSQEVA